MCVCLLSDCLTLAPASDSRSSSCTGGGVVVLAMKMGPAGVNKDGR